jgi:hypothetical protein
MSTYYTPKRTKNLCDPASAKEGGGVRISTIAIIAFMALISIAYARSDNVQLAPDGTYVGGDPNMAPNGQWVGGEPNMAPNGQWVGGQPEMAPNGQWVGGEPQMAPNGQWVGGEPEMAPNGQWLGTGSDSDDD